MDLVYVLGALAAIVAFCFWLSDKTAPLLVKFLNGTIGLNRDQAEMEVAIRLTDFSAEIYQAFLQQPKLIFGARPHNTLYWKGLGWWEKKGDDAVYRQIPFWAAFIMLGFEPVQLAELFPPENPKTKIKRWGDLGSMTLSEENCQKLARLIGRDINVVRQQPYGGSTQLYDIKVAA